jgi:hypothetical protein
MEGGAERKIGLRGKSGAKKEASYGLNLNSKIGEDEMAQDAETR